MKMKDVLIKGLAGVGVLAIANTVLKCVVNKEEKEEEYINLEEALDRVFGFDAEEDCDCDCVPTLSIVELQKQEETGEDDNQPTHLMEVLETIVSQVQQEAKERMEAKEEQEVNVEKEIKIEPKDEELSKEE